MGIWRREEVEHGGLKTKTETDEEDRALAMERWMPVQIGRQNVSLFVYMAL